jgi:deoxyadenosine/deoxycytidine kinase
MSNVFSKKDKQNQKKTETEKQNIQIISIEGNIGSGKSTLLANLQKKYENNSNIIFLREPVDDWETITDINGTTMLKLFYADQKTHSFAFQMMAFISRLKLLKETIENNPNSIIVTERCLYTDRMVFAKMLFDAGDITLENYKIYLKWFETFATDYPIHKTIYVKTTPEICHKRILKRSRDGEGNIPLEYLEKCSNYHEEMMNLKNPNCLCKKQMILNGNVDIYESKDELNNWIQKVHSFIYGEYLITC